MPHTLEQKRSYAAELRRRYRTAGLCEHCGMEEVVRYVNCTRCRRTLARLSLAWWRRHQSPARLLAERERARRYRQRQAA